MNRVQKEKMINSESKIQDSYENVLNQPVIVESLEQFTEGLRGGGAAGEAHLNSAKGQRPKPRPPHKTKYFLGIDWFEATLQNPFVTFDPSHPEKPFINSANPVPTGFRAGKVLLYHNQASRRNKHYRFGFDVLFVPEGAKVTANKTAMAAEYRIGVVSAVPYEGNNCQPGSSIFQVDNHILYREDLWETIDATFAALDVRVSHLTRLDVCLDGYGLLDPASDYYRDKMEVLYGERTERRYEKVGRADYDECQNGKTPRRWQIDDEGNLQIFYVGGLKSKKSLNGYAKGNRIDEENKQYIREAWRKAKLIGQDDRGEEITRLEIRNRKEAMDELNLLEKDTGELLPFNWKRLRDTQYLAGVFKESLRGFYGFKIINHNDSEKSRWEDVEVIDWSAFETADVVRIGRTRAPSEVWRAKHSSLKILRDNGTNAYLARAVQREIRSIPQYTVSPTMTEELSREVAGMGFDLSTDETQFIVSRVSERLSKDVIEYVTAWGGKSIPEAMAWALAEEHNITPYIQDRIRRDSEASGLTTIVPLNANSQAA